jgi:hypothetical protein
VEGKVGLIELELFDDVFNGLPGRALVKRIKEANL